MKKIISLLVCTAILMTCMCMVAAASDNAFTYEIDGIEYTVTIDDSGISSEKQQSIADALVGVNQSEIMPANIWCDLFGHDLVNTTSTVTEHKAKVYAPRCKLLTYDVIYCEDCDYMQQNLLTTNFINCCPEE